LRPESSAGGRVLSIDLLRGSDVLLMLFVNEVAGVPGAPAFLLHTRSGADGMTITDVVFPAFLFVVGMALPFALGARLEHGASRVQVWRHVLGRSLALLVMGVLMVNVEEAAEGWPWLGLWNVLMTIGVVLAWQAPRGPWTARLRLLGAALLVILAFAYRAPDGSGWIQLRPYWWGILGLIGWAYLVAASLYLALGERLAALVGCVALLYCVYLADQAGQVRWLAALHPYLQIGLRVASHAAVTLSGTVLGVLLKRLREAGTAPRQVVAPALGWASGLAAAGLLLHGLRALHPAFSIDKILATPPWCLLSSAATGAAWLAFFVLVEICGWRRWPRLVTLAGEEALLAYLVAPCLSSLLALSAALLGAHPYEALGGSVALGLARSLAFACVVVGLCGLLRSRGVRLRL
jgi:heparan-alpha-glucosaminide N-acetyltransferase